MSALARFLTGLGGVVTVLLLSSCYVTTQGYHLLRTQASATSVERLRARQSLSDEERVFFDRVEAVRTFAAQEIGLNDSDNYTTYVSTDREYLVDVVSAAAKTSFTRKEWWFPFFGRFPYKGFYRTPPARRLAQRLSDDGWDTIVRRVDAFSTLGFFRDPLFTYMLRYSEARLTELIIHEMAHATLWVRDEGQFNEEFATFVGREGSAQFLAETYGADSALVEELREARRDRETFNDDMSRLRDQLDTLYKSGANEEEILDRKEEIIEEFRSEFVATYPERYLSDRFLFLAEQPINNAYVDLFETYTGNLDRFASLYDDLDRDLAVFVGEVVRRVEEWESQPRRHRGPLVDVLPAS